MRHQGKLTQWNDAQGFGFITPSGGDGRVFVHIKSFQTGQPRPTKGVLLTYALQVDAKGRPAAEDVAHVRARPKPATPSRASGSPATLAVVTGFAGALAFAAMRDRLPMVVPGIYLVLSAITFLLYAHDKSSAQRGEWRTPELTLHLLGLIGGWPGALLAQRLLRHKSGKTSFQLIFWVTVAINIAAVQYLIHLSALPFLAQAQ